MNAIWRAERPALTPMTRDALAAVLAVENDIYEFPWTRGNFLDSLDAGYSCWLYGCGADLLGYAVVMLAVDEAHLLNLSVARAAQGRGHGRALLAELCTVVRDHGARTMLLEVRPSNLAGRALYARAGFLQVGLRRGYYPARDGREDALVLRRAL
ncbi:MAG: ribosomal protein S18-alanine N-acetyltransferase [Burkholderiales bacterium]|nr:ribosomal protein S18-alanine N-acetyltransferase [Burkholderiales bacterium]